MPINTGEAGSRTPYWMTNESDRVRSRPAEAKVSWERDSLNRLQTGGAADDGDEPSEAKSVRARAHRNCASQSRPDDAKPLIPLAARLQRQPTPNAQTAFSCFFGERSTRSVCLCRRFVEVSGGRDKRAEDGGKLATSF